MPFHGVEKPSPKARVHAQLAHLAYVLERKQLWPAGWKWSFYHWHEEMITAEGEVIHIGCAHGMGERMFGWESDTVARQIGDEEHHRIFCDRNYDLRGHEKNITPGCVSRRIKRYLARAAAEAQERQSAPWVVRTARRVLEPLDGLARRLQAG